MTDKRLIVALDMSSLDEVKQLVETLGDKVAFYKVGMELFYAVGEDVITYLREQKKDIFLDLKLHDIPNTVAHGVGSLTRLGANFLTIHGQGGRPMMEAAVAKANEVAAQLHVQRPKLLAITVLTSFEEETWTATGGNLPIQTQVIRLAKLAKESGMDGVVASPLEAEAIKKACGEDFLIVTPGVRPSFASANDQQRIATPSRALQSGASHLVIGRPITKAALPREAATLILEEMRAI